MTEEQKNRYRELVKKDYLTEDERDELDMLLTLKRQDPDFNQDEWLNNH